MKAVMSLSVLSAAEWHCDGFYSSVLQQRAPLIGCQSLEVGMKRSCGCGKSFTVVTLLKTGTMMQPMD